MSTIVRYNQLNVSNVVHEKLKKRKGGAKSVKMTYSGNPLMLQLPKTRVPFGLSCFENDNDSNAPKKYSLELTVGGNEELDKVQEMLEDIDIINLDYCSSHSEEWWGKKISADVMREADTYKSLLKPDLKDASNPPRFKVKLPFYNGKPMFNVFNSNREPVEIFSMVDGVPEANFDWAQNGMEVRVIAECEGLWVVNRNVYCTWRVSQLQITQASRRITDYAFMDDGDSGDSGDDGDFEDDGDEEVKDSEDGDEVDEVASEGGESFVKD